MTRWSGAKDSGVRTYTDEQVAQVVARLHELHGADCARRLATLAEDLAIESRTLRAILSDIDGHPKVGVLAYTADDGGVFVAEFYEEAAAYNARLHAQVRTMQQRLERRQNATVRLPRKQAVLFS